MKRILCSIGAGAFVVLLLWLGGMDFTERGPRLALVAYSSGMVAFMTYLFPGWRE